MKSRIIILFIALFAVSVATNGQSKSNKPRTIITTDIGGTDPDDYQSMIHLMMYSDLIQIEGLISSPFGKGRKKDLLDMIDLYEKDFPKLKKYNSKLATPDDLRTVSKQGETESAPYSGFRKSSEGSDWIIECAKKESDQVLWILVWGGIEDLAQALHDAPEIENKIRVYWIGGPNKKWSANAYCYLVHNFPNLYMIENNSTYRGWFMEDANAPKNLSGGKFYANYIKGRGYMAADFNNYYKGHIKMGDTPSLAYLLNGDNNEPTTDSWGGKFKKINRSAHIIFNGMTSLNDSVSVYSILEWHLKGPEIDIPEDSSCFYLEIQNQKWPGYYLGNGIYGVRYSSKKPEIGNYKFHSSILELEGLKGHYVSFNPWPGKANKDDYILGKQWYSDVPNDELFLDEQQGAKNISKFRKEYLMDWAKRWNWLIE